MEVIPNPSLALALALPFLVTLFALWAILFKPLLGYLTEREHAVVHARHETEKLTHEITGRVSALETKLASAREEVTALRAAARSRAVEQQNVIIAAARTEAEEKLQAAVVRIAGEQKAASAVMQESAVSLSRDIASRILGRSVGA